MLKKLVTGVLLLAVVLAVAACSTKESDEEKAQKNQIIYNSVKISVDKVNSLFHKDVAEDETPLLTSAKKEDAKSILDGYFDPALSDQILTHYITDKTIDNRIAVKPEPFFNQDILATKFEDAKVEGEKNEYTVTTKAGKYTVKKVEDSEQYIVTKYEK
ncbi:hypothetical protein [Paenibacillus gansuensis]|uniref:Lipoprotein n=1 Tax=Paenibacillus gansuensis TaxID=306542 RepID=A0ABW5PAW5_9BACL